MKRHIKFSITLLFVVTFVSAFAASAKESVKKTVVKPAAAKLEKNKVSAKKSSKPSVRKKRAKRRSKSRKGTMVMLPKTLVESGLLGIHLLDTDIKITKKFGSPLQMESADAVKQEAGQDEPTAQSTTTPAESSKPKGVEYVRWVYPKAESRYSFLIEVKSGRVVQIEVIGIADPIAKTSQGIKLGDHFSQVLGRYKTPEQYKFGEKEIVVSYVGKYNVLFRLSKNEENKPHRVVGIAVTSGRF
jgi:hypothetical protein